MSDLELLVLCFCLWVVVYLTCFRERVERVRLPNGNQVIVTFRGFRGYRVEIDWNDPQTLQNMNQEMKRINDWWESSKNCKH